MLRCNFISGWKCFEVRNSLFQKLEPRAMKSWDKKTGICVWFGIDRCDNYCGLLFGLAVN